VSMAAQMCNCWSLAWKKASVGHTACSWQSFCWLGFWFSGRLSACPQDISQEIQKLLANWSEYLRAAFHLFVHAPSSNSQAIFVGEPASLNHSDHHIHQIPFTTRRPTMKEAKQIRHLLGTVYCAKESSAALGTEASVKIYDAAAVGIRALSNEFTVLLEFEKTGKV
jgi:hypothetical protein